MKKIIAAFIAITFIMSPISGLILNDHNQTAEARGYKSGRTGFSPSYKRVQKPAVTKKTENNSTFNKSQNTNKANGTTAKRGFFSGGGLMRGLMIGGLAGLLFGGVFANLGAFGSFLGLLINIVAIVFVFNIVRSIIASIRAKRRKEDAHTWRN